MPRSAEQLGVLIVDDDPALLRTMRDVLRLRGFEPDIAQTASRAIELATRTPPAIAVVDLGLPDMDGIDLVGRLHAGHVATEVVVLTGNASIASAVRALREQIFDYLLKPVAPDKLVTTLERAGERWRRRRAEAALATTEQRYRSLIENASDPVAILDADGVIRYASPAYQHTLGVPPETLIGTDVFDALHPEDESALREVLRTLLGTHGATVPVTLRLRGDGEDWRTLAGTAKNLLEDPAIRGIVLNSRDVTEQLALEAQLRHAQKIEAIGQLAGGIAHDLNNMLTAILSFSQLAEAGLPEQHDTREDIQQVQLAAQRAASLTRQLLAFSRRQVLQPRSIDLSEIVRGMEPMLRRLISAEVECTTDLAPIAGPVLADPTQIEQVLLNLVLNARDAMPDGGTIVIETRRVDIDDASIQRQTGVEPGPHIVLSVKDTGSGMDAETQARVFEPFFTTKPTGRGTGLGLSTVYGIVRQSGGSITLHSVKGQGTTFDVYLPCVVGEVSSPPETEARSPTEEVPAMSILVIDDDDAVRRAASRALERAGHTVVTASNGHEALAIAQDRSRTIDLILSDLVMPDLSGWELGPELAACRPAARLLFMSGYTATDTGRTVPMIGHGFLQKPFTPDDLVEKVRQAALAR